MFEESFLRFWEYFSVQFGVAENFWGLIEVSVDQSWLQIFKFDYKV